MSCGIVGGQVHSGDGTTSRCDTQRRRSGRTSEFRRPSNNTNGNFRDCQGRLISCEHDSRRVTRTEHDTIILGSASYPRTAEGWQAEPLRGPNLTPQRHRRVSGAAEGDSVASLLRGYTVLIAYLAITPASCRSCWAW